MKKENKTVETYSDEAALKIAISEARQEAVAKRQRALANHQARLAEAIQAGVGRRTEFV